MSVERPCEKTAETEGGFSNPPGGGRSAGGPAGIGAPADLPVREYLAADSTRLRSADCTDFADFGGDRDNGHLAGYLSNCRFRANLSL